ALDSHRNLLVRPQTDIEHEVFPGRMLIVAVGENPVAVLEPCRLGRRAAAHKPDDHLLRAVDAVLKADQNGDRRNEDRGRDVEGRPGNGYEKTLPFRMREKLVDRPLALALEHLQILAAELDVAAERNGAQTV